MLPDEQPNPEQVEILRATPGEQRLRLAERLYWSVRKIKAAGLRSSTASPASRTTLISSPRHSS